MKIFVRLLLLSALVLAVSCTDPTGASPSGDTSNTTISATPAAGASRIVGTTKYSADGGATQTDATFVFDVPTSAVNKALARALSTADLISVTGYLRAGSLLIELKGTYDQVSKQFTLTASGTLATTRIDITISGTHDPATGTLSAGQTDVAVTDTTGATPPQTFSSTTLAKPADAAAEQAAVQSIVTAKTDTTVQVATPPPVASKKFWEGTWVFTGRGYSVDPSTGSVISSMWLDYTFKMLGTASQYNGLGTYTPNAALSQYVSAGTFGDSEVFVKTISETASELIAVTKCTSAVNQPAGVGSFRKVKAYLKNDGTIWGGNYTGGNFIGSSTLSTSDDADGWYSTEADAEAASIYADGTFNGVANPTFTKIN